MEKNKTSARKPNIAVQRRKFNKLSLIDNALFMAVVGSKDGAEFCRIVIETVLGRKVKIEKVFAEKVIPGIDTDRHGIRIDALVLEVPEGDETALPELHEPDDTATSGILESGDALSPTSPKSSGSTSKSMIYDIEPDKTQDAVKRAHLPQRSRYYVSLSDVQTLYSGEGYDTLPNTVMIMILSYDPFGIGDMRYEGKTMLTTHPDYPYDDGITRIYLYVDGKYNPEDTREKEVHEMLQYMKETATENAVNDNLLAINGFVEAVKKLPPGSLITYYKEMEREHELEEYKHMNEKQTRMIVEKDRMIAEKDQMLVDKDQTIAEQNDIIARQKAMIECLQNQQSETKK